MLFAGPLSLLDAAFPCSLAYFLFGILEVLLACLVKPGLCFSAARACSGTSDRASEGCCDLCFCCSCWRRLKGVHVFVRCFYVSEAEVVVQHAAAASEYMEEQPGVCKEVSVNTLQAKATARVDVPETSKTQGYGGELEETEKVKQSFPVFLRTLQGRHHVLSCCAEKLIADLYEQVADACHMPCEDVHVGSPKQNCARVWLVGRVGYQA